MKNYLIRILYCGEDCGYNYFFKSNKKSLKGILKDFYVLKEECGRDEISCDDAYSYLMCCDDVVELLVCLEDRKVLVSDGNENDFIESILN